MQNAHAISGESSLYLYDMAKRKTGGRNQVTTKAVTKVTSLIKKTPVPKNKTNNGKGITNWEAVGGCNDFPQQLLQSVEASPTASTASDIWKDFTTGSGFVDESLGDEVVSEKGDTFQELHQSVAHDFAGLWGFAILFTYNLKGERTGARHLPFESCRLGELNDDGFTDVVKYNPYYGTDDFNERYTKTYYTYNPENVLDQITKHKELVSEGSVNYPYLGQVYWFSVERPLSRVYPKVFYYSSKNWFDIDAKIQNFHSRNIDNNIFLGGIMNKYGDPDSGAGEPNEDGDFKNTVGEEFEYQMSEFAGDDNAGSILVNWFTNPDEAAKFEAFVNNANEKMFDTLQTMTNDQIAIGYKVPRVLLNIATAGKLGDTQEVINAFSLMQGNTQNNRDILSYQYQKLFKEQFNKDDFTIKRLSPFDVLPDWVVNVMSDEEKRKRAKEVYGVTLDDK